MNYLCFSQCTFGRHMTCPAFDTAQGHVVVNCQVTVVLAFSTLCGLIPQLGLKTKYLVIKRHDANQMIVSALRAYLNEEVRENSFLQYGPHCTKTRPWVELDIGYRLPEHFPLGCRWGEEPSLLQGPASFCGVLQLSAVQNFVSPFCLHRERYYQVILRSTLLVLACTLSISFETLSG